MLPSASPLAPADLSTLNTLALPSEAPALLRLREPGQVADLDQTLPDAFVLGGGSNVVLPRQMSRPVALMALRGIRRLDHGSGPDILIEAAAGENWHALVEHCARQGWGGLENLALIPGTVGAAPVQNIGAYGLEAGERIAQVIAYDRLQRAWVQLDAAACQFAYRDSVFKRNPQRWIITAVQFRLPRQWQPRLDYPDLRDRPEWRDAAPTPLSVCAAVCAIRRAKLPDPARLPNAGSFFKNPVLDAPAAARLLAESPRAPHWPQADGRIKFAAAWLIEQAGWKGRRLGPVGMHEQHALVLVNHGGAQAADVLALAQAVNRDVQARFGVGLEIEPVRP